MLRPSLACPSDVASGPHVAGSTNVIRHQPRAAVLVGRMGAEPGQEALLPPAPEESIGDGRSGGGDTCGLEVQLPEETCRSPQVLALLRLSCEFCSDSACKLHQGLVRAAQDVWAAAPQPCRPAVLSSAIVLLHLSLSFRDQFQEQLRRLATTEPGPEDLEPFPFAPGFLSLYQRFTPAHLLGNCDSGGNSLAPAPVAPRGRTVLLPRDADLTHARCPVALDDSQLLYRCRARRTNSYVLARPSVAGALSGRAVATVLARPMPETPDWRCPVDARPFANKYSEQTFRSCATGHGTWGARIEGNLKCIAVAVAELLQVRQGETVLDWGSGCGWMLTWLHALYGARVYGIEATSSNLAWARRFSAGDTCLWNSTNLSWVPDASFNYVVSYWALYHLRPASSQCAVARQLVAKLRPGGKAWFGGNMPSPVIGISHEPLRRRQWLQCLRSVPQRWNFSFAVEFVPDLALFRSTAVDFGGIRGDYLYYEPTYSTLVSRLPA